jgi:Flp pilus assembly protein TadG
MNLMRFRNGRHGFVTVYMVLGMMVLIPMTGLAIDCSVLYNVKARLQAAVDAAALGAGAMLQSATNLNDPTLVAKIEDAAQRFFSANYPPGYWSSTQAYYSSTPSEDPNTKVRSIYVHAEEYVPMLFLRVLGISQSTVAAQATSSVRFVSLMIVVDRSGSVVRSPGSVQAIQNALTNFIVNTPNSNPPGQSLFIDGRDEIGMITFGGAASLDFSPTVSFRSATPSIATAINNIAWGNSGTNTAEGLYQGYSQLQNANNLGALNVIILLTDGRPSAFTVNMAPDPSSPCLDKSVKPGFVSANVGLTWPPQPPQNWGGQQNPGSFIWTFGFYTPYYSGGPPPIGPYGDMVFVPNSNGCHYSSDPGQLIPGWDANQDFANFPSQDVHGNLTTGPVYQGEGQSMSDPRAIRYASFNAADNQATSIRTDTTIRPVMFVIGLNEPPSGGEPLDADWLARVANDPNYKDSNGNPVYQAGQTAGMYFNVTSSGLVGAFAQISSQILRLSQ